MKPYDKQADWVVQKALESKTFLYAIGVYQLFVALGIFTCWAPGHSVLGNVFFSASTLFEMLCTAVFLIGICKLIGENESRRRIDAPFFASVLLTGGLLFYLRIDVTEYLNGVSKKLWPVYGCWNPEVLSLMLLALIWRNKAAGKREKNGRGGHRDVGNR